MTSGRLFFALFGRRIGTGQLSEEQESIDHCDRGLGLYGRLAGRPIRC